MHKVTGLSEFQVPDGNFFVFTWNNKIAPTIEKDDQKAIQGTDYVNVNAGDNILYILKVDDNNTTYQVSGGKDFSISLTFADVTLESVEETIHDSWQEIFASIDDGTYSTKYSIGDTKFIDLGEQGHNAMQIVAFDADAKADGSGNAAVTWLSMNLLKTTHEMNSSRSGSAGNYTGGTIGGWENTRMRAYLNDTVKPLIPESVRNAIKIVYKSQNAYDKAGSSFIQTTEDDVWLPSYPEVIGYDNTEYQPPYNVAFPNDASRIKKQVGAADAYPWWTRSARSNSYFRHVSSSGGSDNTVPPTYAYGVVLGFCT